MNIRACREAPAHPAATRRLLLTALVLAAAMLADSFACKRGAPLTGAAAELLALAVGAALLAPVARVSRLTWVTAGMVGIALLGQRLAGVTPIPTGGAVLALILSATSPSMGVGIAATGLLVAAELIAPLI